MVEDLLAEAGIPRSQVTGVTPLAGGTFNEVSRVTLADGRRLILKVPPPPDAPVLAYERGILRTEAVFYELAAPNPRLPAVTHAGFGHGGAPDFLLMTELPGQPWPAVTDRIGDRQRRRLRGEADQYRVTLPLPTGVIRQRAARHEGVLDEVTTPVLVHFDLWDGNILVDLDGEAPRIGGLIDAERAFWGDPLADFVSLALLGDVRQDEAFLAGYREAGGPARLDASSRVRLALYRSYLYLIMLVEAAPRGYDASRRGWLERSVAPVLAAELDLLRT